MSTPKQKPPTPPINSLIAWTDDEPKPSPGESRDVFIKPAPEVIRDVVVTLRFLSEIHPVAGTDASILHGFSLVLLNCIDALEFSGDRLRWQMETAQNSARVGDR